MAHRQMVTFRDPQTGYKVTEEMNVLSHNESTTYQFVEEYAIGDCGLGCKIYFVPYVDVLFLQHNSNYGCRR